jgi:GNAT superfamily N-acetyltransferase
VSEVTIVRVPTDSAFKEPLVWIAIHEGECIGHCRMTVESTGNIKFHDAWVHEDYRRIGVYSKLFNTRWEYAKKHFNGKFSYAWCKETSLPLYIKNGYEAGEVCVHVIKKIE